jgi:hypothetical protein
MKKIFIPKIRHALFIFCLTIASHSIGIVSAAEAESLTLKYTLMSEGEKIGAVTHRLFQNENGHSFAEYTHIKVSGWWGKIDISSSLLEEFDGVNGFISADSKTLDGNTSYWSKIGKNKNGLWGSYAEIKDTTDQESEELTNLGAAISNSREPIFGKILSISRDVFKNRSIQPEGMQFTRQDFDTTDTNLPFFIQSFGRKSLPHKLRLLDTDNLTISETDIADLGFEVISIGDKQLRSRHLKLSGSKYKPSHIWIKDTATDLPYMVRFVGEDEDGPIEITLNP